MTGRTLILGAALGFSGLVAAEDQSCSGDKAYFSATTGVVCLPSVAVPTPSGLQYYQAQLQWINGSTPFRFTLTSASPITAPKEARSTYAMDSGLLTIPRIEQYEQFGTNRFSVNLQLIPNTTPAQFQLNPNVGAIIPPTYEPGKTWKPYVGLLPYEREALIALGQSQPFAALAVQVYDFNIKSIGTWDLKETASNGSGMQAGVYVNNQTSQVVLAFRGTEFCIDPFSCSFSQLKESLQDVKADTFLTQGHDSGQFNDAYLFAQQILNQYAGRKLVVTGHSLGGGLAQAIGAAFKLETYAFNSSPVPNNYFDDHGIKQFDPTYKELVHVLSDIHDPVSNTDYSGKLYADAAHVSPAIFFDFDKREIAPTYKAQLDNLRFNKHTMDKLRDNITGVMQVFQEGW